MKISLLKLSRKKEVIKRIELSELAEMIRENPEKDEPNMSWYVHIRHEGVEPPTYINLGVLSDLELRSITGHESQKNFEGYIRIGISEQAQRVGDKIKAAREAMKKQVDK